MIFIKKFKLISFFLFIFILTGLISCSKKSDSTSDKEVNTAEMETVSNGDYTESDEDLLSVDYKEFYDELAPHGEWIEVKGSDIGVDLKKNTASGKDHRTISIGDLFGIKDAYADDVGFGAFFVWQPASDLAVGVTTGTPSAYVPYTNGQWINTSNGWYFRATSETEEITHHYGRWVLSPSLGWVWLPGRVWSPAWVDWREQDDYIAWEPLPPSIYIVNNTIITPPVYEERYVVIEKRYFAEPEIYRYMYKENKNKIMIKEWRRPDGIMVANQMVINRGPDVTMIQRYYGGTPFGLVTINPVRSITQVSYNTTEYRVFTPEFRKVKTQYKINKVVSSPKKFEKYESASSKYEKEKQERSNYKTEQGKDNNYKENENKFKKGKDNFRENRKYIDDSKMKDGGKTKDNGNNKDGNNDNRKKDNNKRDNGNKDNGKKEKIDKKGSNDKSNGKNEKGNKKFRKDQSKDQNKGKDKGSKDYNKSGKNSYGSEKKQNNQNYKKGNKK